MKTVNQAYLETGHRAFAQKAMLQRAIDADYGDYEFVVYFGTFASDAKYSNRARALSFYEAMGYRVVADFAGPKRRRKSEGSMNIAIILR